MGATGMGAMTIKFVIFTFMNGHSQVFDGCFSGSSLNDIFSTIFVSVSIFNHASGQYREDPAGNPGGKQ